ncbi:hypothetical protein [Cohnella silvisoli]|uniref:SMI1/KNR4 family protein n=1 Tax=Cohnella silvisoli TaxID=2873699 RepID=A0ABV1KNT4_9BACL|nr:hypothetical protein [Cohnella silvisoli]MCD9020978.1 hypothetical protein [Cohnella silvisoli]
MMDKPDQSEKIISAPLPVSFTQLRIVSQDELTRRMEPIKALKEDVNELYRLVKDTETGEHYLHYAVFHLNVAGGGAEEEYHHLLPLEHDDVIALALGAPLFQYPGEWNCAYLRNGPDGGFVWYDPSGVSDNELKYAETEAYIREQLLAFRKSGAHGEEEVKRLLEEMDKHLPPRTEKD